jgi:uncharacterized membrane protein YebE (DUF533 family)
MKEVDYNPGYGATVVVEEERTLEARIAAALAAGDIDERDAREIRRIQEAAQNIRNSDIIILWKE